MAVFFIDRKSLDGCNFTLCMELATRFYFWFQCQWWRILSITYNIRIPFLQFNKWWIVWI